MTDTTYNGWRNYATWRVNLELFDGEDDVPPTGAACEDWAEEMLFFEIPDGLAKDYARAFLSDVDWQEIADAHQPETDDEGEAVT